MKIAHALDGQEWLLNCVTIHIHEVLRYLHSCIKRAATSAVQQPSHKVTVLASKEGYGYRGKNPT
jgi:hypothetical protein